MVIYFSKCEINNIKTIAENFFEKKEQCQLTFNLSCFDIAVILRGLVEQVKLFTKDVPIFDYYFNFNQKYHNNFFEHLLSRTVKNYHDQPKIVGFDLFICTSALNSYFSHKINSDSKNVTNWFPKQLIKKAGIAITFIVEKKSTWSFTQNLEHEQQLFIVGKDHVPYQISNITSQDLTKNDIKTIMDIFKNKK